MADQGYSPEEIAALRSKLVGSSTVSPFDKKASDVSASASRLASNPYVSGILGSVGGASPATPMLRDAVGQASLSTGGGVGDLSKKTQGALADQVTSPGGTILRPLENQTPDIAAVPSLKDQLMAKLQGNTGGGTNSGIGGLRAAYLASRRRQIGDFETDKELAGEQGINKAVHVDELSALQNAHAAKMQRDAEIDQQAAEKAHEQHQALINQNLKIADDIGRQQIDPKRLIKSQSTAENVMHILGGALGGALAARTGGPNQFLDRFDRQVSEDIQAQLNAIDNKKVSLGARQTALGQMIQATGDRRLGVQAYRNAMYEAAKQHLAAEDARLGVPEIRTGAQQNIQALQHQQDGMQTQYDAEALQTAQQQAAAAAAAQRAAENAAWQRQKDIFEMGLKKDQLEIERAKAAGGSADDLNKQAQHLGEALADPKLAMGRAAVEASKMRLDKAAPGEGLPGVGTGADLREKLAGRPQGAAALFPQNWIINKVAGLNDEERVSRNDWAAVRQAYINQATGSGGSAEERADIINTFQGAQTPAEQRAAIAKADAFFKQQEVNHKASVDPRAAALVDQRKAGLLGIQPKSGNVSDERAKTIKKRLGGY